MRKNVLSLSFILALSIFIISCASNSIEKIPTISRNFHPQHHTSSMGVNYEIKNIKKGKYNINLSLKLFEKGNFIKEENLYNSNLDSSLDSYNIGIYQENNELKLFVNERSVKSMPLDFFKTPYAGIALFGIEQEKDILLNSQLPIAGYIMGDEVKNIQHTNIDEIFKNKSNYQIVVYFKLVELI